ncbi:hypothetical protein OBBRIDRAFT_530563 [Obba rivulosa]|uniref:Uncharacterized protein n=1 Tax=Obba rivulosa TaxID=1052685 RepID=A0A8E2DNT5_9APHY|nr:hypothetical protein OBBRIDRAFT_530563 [Obba rivulosa]
MFDKSLHWNTRYDHPTVHDNLDVPLAVQSYVDQQLRLIPAKSPGCGRSPWLFIDLRQATNQRRLEHKAELLKQFPAMLAGRHWEQLSQEGWVPLCIVRMSVPRRDLAATSASEDLELCNVIWQCEAGPLGLSFYSNNQNTQDVMNYLACNTSEVSNDAPKVVDFGVASQFLVQLGRKTYPRGAGKLLERAEVSIRTGLQVGNCKRSTSASGWEMKITDYTPMTFEEYMEAECERWASLPISSRPVPLPESEQVLHSRFMTHEHLRIANRLAVPWKPGQRPRRTIVPTNDFSITVLGLPASLSAHDFFSGIYGMTLVSHHWKFPGPLSSSPQVHFYRPPLEPGCTHPPRFYHRDRLVPNGLPVCQLGINYTGQLEFSSDGMVHPAGKLYEEYKKSLSYAVQQGFAIPELALLLALDILDDNGDRDGTIGRVLRPTIGTNKEHYRNAFQSAWSRRNPLLPSGQTFYPCADALEEGLVIDCGLIPMPVFPHVRSILMQSGAFPAVATYARTELLKAPPSGRATGIPGYDRLQRGMVAMLPGLTKEGVSMRQYKHRYPITAWVESPKMAVFREPEPCTAHGVEKQCVCWVAQYLCDAAREYSVVHPEFGTGETSLLAKLSAHITCTNCIEVILGVREVADTRGDENTTDHVCMRRKAMSENKPDTQMHIDLPPPALRESSMTQLAVNTPTPPPSPSRQRKEGSPDRVKSSLIRPTESAPMDTASSTSPYEGSEGNVPMHGDVSSRGNPDDMQMEDLLAYCTRLVRRRNFKDRRIVSQQVNTLTAEKRRLKEKLIQQSRTEEELRSALMQQKQKLTTYEAECSNKVGLLHEKDSRIVSLEETLRGRDQRIDELEASLHTQETRTREMAKIIVRLESQLREKEQVMAGVKRLLEGPSSDIATHDGNTESDRPQDREPLLKRMRTDS